MEEKKFTFNAKKILAYLLVFVLLVLSFPITFLLIGFTTPGQFSNTYFGEFAPMTERLYSAKDKKIVVIGTSGVAFGVDSGLLETLLNEEGYSYTVCNYGLYGALGVKVMLDVAKDSISEGDIVLFLPEPSVQTMSLFFSTESTWRAIDGHFSLLNQLAEEHTSQMVGSFPAFVAEKYKYLKSGEPAIGSGVYASASFNDHCDLKNFPRPYNTMFGGYDATTLITFEDVIQDEFIDYLNDYADFVREKGATPLFGFAAMNEQAVVKSNAPAYFDELYSRLRMDILGNPYDAMYDYGWFYDSNVHLNEAGMTRHTLELFDQFKTYFGNENPTTYPQPSIPSIPSSTTEVEGSNQDADAFEYTLVGDYYEITGLSETGKMREVLEIPASFKGVPVKTFTPEVFSGNETIKEITIQANVVRIKDSSFAGCTSLTKVHLTTKEPKNLMVGIEILTDADKAMIYVPASVHEKYVAEYVWGWYYTNGRIVKE